MNTEGSPTGSSGAAPSQRGFFSAEGRASLGAGAALQDDESVSVEERLARALERERQLRAALQNAADTTAGWLRVSEERWGDALRQIATEAYVTSQQQQQQQQPQVSAPPKIPSLAPHLLHHNLGLSLGAGGRQAPVIPSLQLQQAMMLGGLQLSGRSQQASSRLETPSSAMSSDRTHGTARGDASEGQIDMGGGASKPPVPFLRLSALSGPSPGPMLSASKKDKARLALSALSAQSSSHSPSSPAIVAPLLSGMLGRHYDPVGCGAGDPMSERSRSAGGSARTHDSGVEV